MTLRCSVCFSSDLQVEEEENGESFVTCFNCGHQGIALDRYED